jgi:methionyl-tRNA formyltransferase
MRIIFMGTPAFAVPTLIKLYEAGYIIPTVITATDKLGGRGKKELLQSAVKKAALELHIPVMQPTNLKNAAFIEEIKALKPDLFIVVAFRMLPEVLWRLPPLGTINLHASLLPDYRGAAPIHWAIINGEVRTGVTTFFIRKEMDTGPIIKTKAIDILSTDDAGTLHDKLMDLGADLVLDSLVELANPSFSGIPQKGNTHKLAPKLHYETGKIDLTKNSKEIIHLIRGLSPYPGAWLATSLGDIKILSAIEGIETSLNFYDRPIITNQKSFLYLKTGNGYISLQTIQLPGKKPMDIKAYLNGNRADSWF